MALRVPETDKPKLVQFLNLKPPEIDQLYDALATTAPSLDATEFISQVGEKAGLVPSVSIGVVRFLLNLYWVYTDNRLTPDVVAEDVVQAARDAGLNEPSHGGWDNLSKNVRRFLSLEKTLGVTAKALFVAMQFPRHFHTARVITEARPVFGSDPSLQPVAFVINHCLQMEVHENESDAEWYVAMNTADLEELKAAVERALVKEKSLQETLALTKVPVLRWEV